MRSLCQKGIVILLFFLLLMIPQRGFAAETVTDKDFNKNKQVKISAENTYEKTGKYTWIKYQPSADGYLTVTASDITDDASGATGYITLYNSTKSQAYSSKTIYYNTKNTKNAYWYKSIFGMQKDQIYYLRIKSETPVKLTRVFKKVNDKSAAMRTAGTVLKKNKTRTGLIPAGTAAADWYKVTLTKNQKLKIYYNAKTFGAFRISIYSANRHLGSYNVSYTSKQQKLTICQYNYSTGKKIPMNAGTYYIKIEKANSQSSGYYKLKWK